MDNLTSVPLCAFSGKKISPRRAQRNTEKGWILNERQYNTFIRWHRTMDNLTSVPFCALSGKKISPRRARRNTEKEWIVNVIQYNTPKSRYKPHQPTSRHRLLYRFLKPGATSFLWKLRSFMRLACQQYFLYTTQPRLRTDLIKIPSVLFKLFAGMALC